MLIKSEFIKNLNERDFINQTTDLEALDNELTTGPKAAYLGFDATADCLHVGSLIPIMMLRWLQKSGHKPIILLGGATTKIGDPSDKDEMRKMLDDETISQNIDKLQQIFNRYLKFGDGPTDAIILNNNDWLCSLNYLDFLRDYGKHFSINRMLTMESVKGRLDREQSLTFLEFNYMILQAYDFYHLNKDYDCVLQMGGSDQWGNIVSGIDLTRRLSNKTVYGLTTHLIKTATGAKMGKSAAGAIWLRDDRLSAYDFWQFWRNTHDEDVSKFLKLFTDLPMDKITELELLQGAALNEAKKVLADEVTILAHGVDALPKIHTTVQKIFETSTNGGVDSLPRVEVSAEDINSGIAIVDIFCQAGLAQSKGEVRRLIKGRGVKVNDIVIDTTDWQITKSDLNDEGFVKLSVGKKKHAALFVK